MPRSAVALLATSLLVGLAACAEQLTPENVADRFWRAVITQHPSKIRRYVSSADQQQLRDDPDILPVSAYKLGRILIDGDRANVETHLTLDGDTPVTLQIETRLLRERDQWRVDYQATVNEISLQGKLASVIEKIGAMGDTLKQGIDRSVDDITRALPAIEQELSRMEAEIKQRVPELREQLEAFSKRLEEALRSPPAEAAPQPNTEPAPDGTIAL